MKKTQNRNRAKNIQTNQAHQTKAGLFTIQRPPMESHTRGQGTIEYRGRPGGSSPLARPGPRPLYDFTRPPIDHHTRGQGTIEYVLMLAGVLMIVALVGNFLLSNVLVKQTKTLGNESDQIKDYKKQLQQQTSATGPTATPTPSPTP